MKHVCYFQRYMQIQTRNEKILVLFFTEEENLISSRQSTVNCRFSTKLHSSLKHVEKIPVSPHPVGAVTVSALFSIVEPFSLLLSEVCFTLVEVIALQSAECYN